MAGQRWTREPFILGDEGERLYGRGTTDMKGFIACVLAVLPSFAARKLPLPVHVALSYDEEVGGIGLNVVPSRCSFSFEARSTDEADLDGFIDAVRKVAERDVLPGMRAVAPESDVRFELLTRYPALQGDENDAVVALARDAAGEADTGVISFGSEGGLFAAAGIPAVVCGPGSMEQGHKPDEYVTRSELRRCLAFLLRIGDELERGVAHNSTGSDRG